jgi:hypothetical protein
MTTFAELHARLSTPCDHYPFTGPPIDIGDLAPDELGTLWPLLQAAQLGPNTDRPICEYATQVLRQAEQRELVPRLDSATLLATLHAVPPDSVNVAWLLAHAGYLATSPDPSLEGALEPLLPPDEEWFRDRYALLAIARAIGATRTLDRLVDAVTQRGKDSLAAREFAVLRNVRLSAVLTVAGRGYYDPRRVGAGRQTDPASVLADDPYYVVFARRALEEAARLIDHIHAGEVPYKADGAFDPEDASVLGLAACVAATRDEAWYPDVISRLLPGACVAPGAARTAPSQALTIVLSHAVVAVPTPEAVVALRQALKVVRHAGLQRKLARHQKPAERGLVRRPVVALRLVDAGLEPKQQRELLTRFFEASFVRSFELPYAQWRERLLGNDVVATLARKLIWRAGASFMLEDGDQPVDAQRRSLAIAVDAQVSLWHPVEADEKERDAWRARIAQRQLRQPARQAFREFYQPPDADIFAGYELATLRLIGLARHEGWTLEFDDLTRQFGDLRVNFNLTYPIYPGFDGVVGSRAMRFFRGATFVPLHEVSPRIVSEACRAVDLLVSISAIAVEMEEDGYSPERNRRVQLLADQAGVDAMRRHAIARVLQPQIAAGTVTLEGFHVHAGGAKVSMRTGRVVRNGTPVELRLNASSKRLHAVPWLPYDEALLERVIHSVSALLGADRRW